MIKKETIMSPNLDIIVCSFYTDDEYYRAHGERLSKNLTDLGVSFVLREISKNDGEDWADICRKKVPFLAEVCAANPDKKVFWMDVDCMLLDLPDYVFNSSADIIGFQRGYSSPLTIGYEKRTRFWEPSFWGVSNSPLARKMINEAAALENKSEIRATDDYFMEEAWKANCDNLTFQIIPSNAVIGRGSSGDESRGAFFKFGASGNVAEFKGKVKQHTSRRKSKRKRLLTFAKKLEKMLPSAFSSKLRLISDSAGITGLLTTPIQNPEYQKRKKLSVTIMVAARTGNVEGFNHFKNVLENKHLMTPEETKSLKAAASFLHYAAKPSDSEVALSWWVKPFPGNFGDWLSPLIVSHYTDKKVIFQSPVKLALKDHMIALGSIGRFIKPNSVVVGTGISTDELTLVKSAKYVSVRGPVTARVVKESGGPTVDSFGDPGVLISRIFPVERANTNGRVALVRHFTHKPIPLTLDENMDELDIFMSHPNEIKLLVATLNSYDRVVTSAMHIFITCQSYGIPCALVTFEGFEDSVHGNGIKYGDYAEGVGLAQISPIPVGLNFTKIDFENITTDHKISSAKLDEVEAAIVKGLSYL
jgi:hypothetical protein